MADTCCYEDPDTGVIYNHLCSISCNQRLCDGIYCPAFCYCYACRNFECPKNPATPSDVASYMKKHPELLELDEPSLDDILDDELPF